jgi:hypothetical protein
MESTGRNRRRRLEINVRQAENGYVVTNYDTNNTYIALTSTELLAIIEKLRDEYSVQGNE